MRPATVPLIALALLAVALAAPSAGLAQAPPPASTSSSDKTFKLTIAARSCPTYADITANRARNNIQESLKDLGADTPYKAGEAVKPSIEDANQPNCTPITGWTFTLGTGIRSRAVSGPWGSLSIVTNPYSGTPTTLADTPLLSSTGGSTGSKIKGAVTITLTKDQAEKAAKGSLWIQGGTPTDPILNKIFPEQYGFGALRCAIDNLNGDNVEWIGYPQGATHVFCYAYYVKPPPTSGTIIVRKRVDVPAGTAPQDFRFEGNISFNTDRSFTLEAAPGRDGSQTFYRAEVAPGGATEPWDFAEQVPPGWRLDGVGCSSATGRSTFTIDQAQARTAVRLAAGDTVTCLYLNRLKPPPAGLELFKTTVGSVGRFGFRVENAQGARTATATTKERDVPTPADPARFELEPGAVSISENFFPVSPTGTWKLTGVTCNGKAIEDPTPVRLTLSSGEGQACVFENTFTPNGSITLNKVTRGATGTTGFLITNVENQARQFRQSATTTREDEPVRAKGDATDRLKLGRYVIQETTPTEPTDGEWTLDSLLCDGLPVPTNRGQAVIELTRDDPKVDCTFTNLFTRAGTGGEDGGGGDGGGGNGGGDQDGDLGGSGDPVNPFTDLAVTKSVSPQVIGKGGTATYTVVVRNISKVTAEDVTVAERRRQTGIGALTVRPSRGSCTAGLAPVCRLGTLKPGASATISVTVRPPRAGRYTDIVATNTSTNEANKRNNRAAATLVVRPTPQFTG